MSPADLLEIQILGSHPDEAKGWGSLTGGISLESPNCAAVSHNSYLTSVLTRMPATGDFAQGYVWRIWHPEKKADYFAFCKKPGPESMLVSAIMAILAGMASTWPLAGVMRVQVWLDKHKSISTDGETSQKRWVTGASFWGSSAHILLEAARLIPWLVLTKENSWATVDAILK